MKGALLICLLILTMASYASAQDKTPPTLSDGTQGNGPIPNKVINDAYESCLYHIPDRFTPDARKYYCTCNTASLQGNFRMDEYRELQRSSNRKPGNKTFEKYIHVAVAPCLDMPVKQIEYLYCLLDSVEDVRIGSVPSYCGCVSRKLVKHAKALAEAEIMTKLAEQPGVFDDPVDALWNNHTYLNTKYKSRDDCILEGY